MASCGCGNRQAFGGSALLWRAGSATGQLQPLPPLAPTPAAPRLPTPTIPPGRPFVWMTCRGDCPLLSIDFTEIVFAIRAGTPLKVWSTAPNGQGAYIDAQNPAAGTLAYVELPNAAQGWIDPRLLQAIAAPAPPTPPIRPPSPPAPTGPIAAPAPPRTIATADQAALIQEFAAAWAQGHSAPDAVIPAEFAALEVRLAAAGFPREAEMIQTLGAQIQAARLAPPPAEIVTPVGPAPRIPPGARVRIHPRYASVTTPPVPITTEVVALILEVTAEDATTVSGNIVALEINPAPLPGRRRPAVEPRFIAPLQAWPVRSIVIARSGLL